MGDKHQPHRTARERVARWLWERQENTKRHPWPPNDPEDLADVLAEADDLILTLANDWREGARKRYGLDDPASIEQQIMSAERRGLMRAPASQVSIVWLNPLDFSQVHKEQREEKRFSSPYVYRQMSGVPRGLAVLCSAHSEVLAVIHLA